MLNAWASGTKPWSYPEIEDAIRDVMRLRIRFVPYLYSAFARYHFDGTPPFRSTVLEEGAVSDRSDQYMMGDSVLVAPLFTGEKERDVELPTGAWYDFYTGAFVGEGGTHSVSAPLDRIPLFVRDGAILPLDNANDNGSMEYRYYGTARAGSTRLYMDDGETYAYEQGEYTWVTLSATRGPDGLQGAVDAPEGDAYRRLRDGEWRMMTKDA